VKVLITQIDEDDFTDFQDSSVESFLKICIIILH